MDFSITEIVLAVLSVLGPIAGYFAGKTKNSIDDVMALAATDPEARELITALIERVKELKEEADADPE